MMKVTISLCLLAFLAEASFAQTDSLSDVFPLRVGNTWSYDFYIRFNGGSAHYAREDTGSVEYRVLARVASTDSTVWRLLTRRTFTRYNYSYPGGNSTEHIEDSSSFTLVELNEGRHPLYAPAFDVESPFPFGSCFSTRFLRYVTTDSTGNSMFTRNSVAQCTIAYTAELSLRRNTGVVLSTTHTYHGVTYDTRYYLRAFSESPYSGPYLGCPRTISVTSLVGIPKDTTLVLQNPGIDTLRIQSFSISDSSVTTSLSSNEISPFRQSALTLRYTAPTPGVHLAKVIFQSNSVSSPDTIVLAFANRMAGATQFDHVNFNFGMFYMVPAYRDTQFAITNTGNVHLTFDSIHTSDPDFFILMDRSNLAPGQTRTCTIRFAPDYPSPAPKDASLLFFTNSVTSPDTIRATGWGVGGRFAFEPDSINFSEVRIGHSADTTITITRRGFVELGLGRELPSYPAFSGLGVSYRICDVCDPFVDSLRFTPNVVGPIHGYVAYTTSNGDRRGTDTIWLSGVGVLNDSIPNLPTRFSLSQNYPNPFNPGTTIEFSLPVAGFVTLKAFDLLGREVATLVNEEMQPGSYEKKLDGSGLASGVYLYQLRAGGFVQTKKLLLLR